MDALFSSWLFWAVCAVVLIVLAFLLGSRTAERAAGDERDELIKYYDGRLAASCRENKIGLDRFQALLDDANTRVRDNNELAVELENKWQPQPAEHHRGKAAAYRDILIRYRGW